MLYFTLVNYESKNNSGVIKKIDGQSRAFRNYATNFYKAFIKNDGLYIKEDQNEYLLKKFLFPKYGFIEKRISYYLSLLKFIEKHSIDVIYIRYHLSDHFFIRFIKKCKEMGVRIYLEFATYPYDKELTDVTLKVDKHYRKHLKEYIDKAVIFSNHNKVFGIDAIKIENGIDVDSIKVIKVNRKKQDSINLIGVANVSRWHGYDRVILGLKEYYKHNPNIKVRFNIVGEGPELNNLKRLTQDLDLGGYIRFHGEKTREDLDEIFNLCDIGIGSLANHRKGLYKDSALKNREYCARGIPFIIASKDDDFPEDFKYVFRIPTNDSSVDIKGVISFYDLIYNENHMEKMTRYAEEKLTWDAKMKPVIREIKTMYRNKHEKFLKRGELLGNTINKS